MNQEAQPELPTPNSPEAKKPFIKRFWWVGLILMGVVAVLFGLAAFSGHRHDQKVARGEISSFDKGKGFNERVVKTFTPPSGTAFKYASPMLYNDHLYIGTSERIGYDNAPVSKGHDNFFYKFDLNFNVSWQYPLGKKMVAGGAVMDSQHNLYFTTELLNDKDNANKKERIYATTYLMSLTENGKFRWEKQISKTDEMWDHAFLTPAISADDIIYIGNDRFYAFDVSGNNLAKYPAQDSLRLVSYGGAPVIDKAGNVYFTSPEPISGGSSVQKEERGTEVIRAYKFAPKLASLVWATEMGNELMDNEGGNPNGGGGQRAVGIESPPVFGVDGKSLYGAVGCTISKIDTSTGQLLWSLKPDGATGHFNASPAIDGQDNLYIGTKSNTESRFYAISASGKQLWRTQIGADLYNSPILGDDGKIYVGSETLPDGKFHVLDRKTGVQKWAIGGNDERKIPDFCHDAMLLYKGYVYVGVHSADEGNADKSFSPTLFKIRVDAKNYLPGSPWPRIYGGNSNSGRP